MLTCKVVCVNGVWGAVCVKIHFRGYFKHNIGIY